MVILWFSPFLHRFPCLLRAPCRRFRFRVLRCLRCLRRRVFFAVLRALRRSRSRSFTSAMSRKPGKITWKLLVLDGLIMFFFMIFVDMLLVFCWMAFQDGFQCSVRVFGLNGLIKVQLGRKLYIKWYILTTGTIGFRSLYHYPWYRIWGCSGNCVVIGWMVNTGINITDIWLIIDGYWWFKIIVQWYTTEQTILGDRINIFC